MEKTTAGLTGLKFSIDTHITACWRTILGLNSSGTAAAAKDSRKIKTSSQWIGFLKKIFFIRSNIAEPLFFSRQKQCNSQLTNTNKSKPGE
jgi:hypothetical protein